MANLNNTYADSLTGYRGMLNLGASVGLNLTSTLQYVSDGMGNASPLYLSTTQVGVRNDGLVVTQDITKGHYVYNATSATLAVPVQISPASMYVGTAWKSDATAASRQVGFRLFTTPITGAAAVAGYLGIDSSVDGALGTWVNRLKLSTVTLNTLTVTGSEGGGIILGDFDATYGGMWSKNVTPSASNYMFVSNGDNTVLNSATTLRFAISDSAQMFVTNGLVTTPTSNMVIGHTAALGTSARLSVKGTSTNDLMYLQLAGATLGMKVDYLGNGSFAGSITTASPTSGSAGATKLGRFTQAVLIALDQGYIRMNVDGVDYLLSTCSVTTP